MLNVDYELNFTYIICISLYLLHKSARVTSMKNIFNYLNMLTNKLQASNSDIESSTSNFLSIIEFLEFLSLLHVNVDSFILVCSIKLMFYAPNSILHPHVMLTKQQQKTLIGILKTIKHRCTAKYLAACLSVCRANKLLSLLNDLN